MSSYAQPNVLTFKATAAIPKGSAVKAGASNQYVTLAAAATDKIIGIAMNAATAANEFVEVALPGGGASGLAGGVIAFGDLLTSDAAGALVATTTANNRVVAIAMDAAAANDLVSVHVVVSNV